MKKEIFKDVVGYEGKYQVSNLGNVKSLNYLCTGKEKVLKPGRLKSGYLMIILCKGGIGKNFYIYRLVASAFLDNYENKKEVNHIDGNKENNKVENLEWCTKSENNLHRFKILGHRSCNLGKFGKDNHRSKKVSQYDLEGNFIKTWDCMSDITRELGINGSSISNVCQGKRKTAGRFIWKYTYILALIIR